MSSTRIKDYGDVDKGLAVNETLSETDKFIFANKKFVKFSKESINEYKIKFEELKKLRIIDKSCKFDSHNWYGLGNYHNIHFSFETYEFDQEIYNALKCFVVIELLDIGVTIGVLSLRYSEIRRAIIEFDYFREDAIVDFEDYIINTDKILDNFTAGLKSFLCFHSINESELFVETLQYAGVRGSDYAREIPNYNSIAWFDYLINNFMKEFSGLMIKKYYPIYLWWKITTVIPIRPIEFINLEADCVRIGDGGEYIMEIPRMKQNKSFYRKKSLPIVDKIKTNKEIFELLSENLRIMGIPKEEKLFSLNAYSDFYEKKYRVIKERFSYNNFRELLIKFYEEIIVKHYGFNVVNNNDELECLEDDDGIVRLRLGDTRHMAFCSMMLQGLNPLVIAQLGGHRQLETQSHYGEYLSEYLDSYTRMLVKVLKENDKHSSNIFNEKYLMKDKINIVFKHYGEKPQREIEHGYCYSENFPYECTNEDCEDCDYFGIDLDKIDSNYIDELNKKYKETRLTASSDVEFLQKYYKEIMKDGSINLQSMTCSDSVEGDLSRLSKGVKEAAHKEAKMMMKMEAISEAYEKKMEISEEKNYE